MAMVAVGFRVKSGWAAAVVISGPSSSPSVLHVGRVPMSDPAAPETRQPFHAIDDAQGDLELDEHLIRKRVEIVRRVTNESVGKLLADCRASGWIPQRAGIVAGSLVEPSTIRQPHIRAHAMEGHLFRMAVEEALKARGLTCLVLAERTAFDKASRSINRDVSALKKTLADFGRRLEGPWRAEEKLAALAAWMAVSEGGSTG